MEGRLEPRPKSSSADRLMSRLRSLERHHVCCRLNSYHHQWFHRESGLESCFHSYDVFQKALCNRTLPSHIFQLCLSSRRCQSPCPSRYFEGRRCLTRIELI